METFAGSIEILTANNESLGVPGVALDAGMVPSIVAALHGITQMTSVAPAERPTGRQPEAEWTGRDMNNQDVTVLLWRDEA